MADKLVGRSPQFALFDFKFQQSHKFDKSNHLLKNLNNFPYNTV